MPCECHFLSGCSLWQASTKLTSEIDYWIVGFVLVVALGIGGGILLGTEEPKLRTTELNILIAHAIKNGRISRASGPSSRN